ncbi:MAG: UDP-N-acetylmuramate dehydrogenase [Nostocoides sp.]
MEERHDVPLKSLTTIGVGGPAARLVRVESTDELVDAVREVDDADEPLLILSGGSNLVIADEGFSGTVIQIATRGVTIESVDRCGGANVRLAAGEPWDGVVQRSVDEGWAGTEALSGIPGCSGTTVVQNVGAYGQEVAQTVASVRVWDRQQAAVRTFANAECGFTYRHSRFKGTDRYVVLDVLFQLHVDTLSRPIGYADVAERLGVPLGGRAALAEVRDAVLGQRRRRGMVLDPEDRDTWSCGSFFTNPVLDADQAAALRHRVRERLGADAVAPEFPAGEGAFKTSAAWLIERAGFPKGYGLPGPAALSTKHTLAVTNRGQAGASDIVALAREVRDGVRSAFGVTLVNEPVLIGLAL